MKARRRVLLGQLGAKGDCLYATTVARQIKHDDPDCHLTWAIGSAHRSVIQNNPDVDQIWDVPIASSHAVFDAWMSFERQARQRQRSGDFDDVFFTQIHPRNWANFDGTVRASIFRGYPHPITVPVTPVVRLTDRELANARGFAERHRLADRPHVVLFESMAMSGQSFMNADFALDTARLLVKELPGTCVILSSAKPLETGSPDIIDGSALAFLENAALTPYCSLVVGCSSGLTWLCTSDAAVPRPMIQLLSRGVSMYGAVVHDLEYWKLPSDHVIEMRDCPSRRAADCMTTVLLRGVGQARREFHEPLQLDFTQYCQTMLPMLRRGRVRTVARSLSHTVKRYGARPELASGLLRALLPT